MTQSARATPVVVPRAVPAAVWDVIVQLGGFCSRDYAVAQNLYASPERVRQYLGTYLPRTVFEVQTIAAELLRLQMVAQSLPKDRPFRVLDVGSGTGGAWLGLVYGLCAQAGIQQVEVHAVDGNACALAQQAAFAVAVAADTGIALSLHTHECRLDVDAQSYREQLAACVQAIGGEFDFVLVSKHLNELYVANPQAAVGAVAAATEVLSACLSEQGYLLLLETTCVAGSNFFPVTMAKELAFYAQQNPDGLQTILPVPCALFAQSGCDAGGQAGCFTQREFALPYGQQEVIRSKATYRVLARAQQASWVRVGYPKNVAYRVSSTNNKPVCAGGRRGWLAQAEDGFVPVEFFAKAA